MHWKVLRRHQLVVVVCEQHIAAIRDTHHPTLHAVTPTGQPWNDTRQDCKSRSFSQPGCMTHFRCQFQHERISL